MFSKALWLLMFVALGCSQRGCSCKRLETIRQEIVIADRLGENVKDKFPQDFVNLIYIKNLLYVKDADTMLQRFKPNVTLKRLDTGVEISNVQKLGMNDWQRFIRSIFTLSPDNYDPDLENRFNANEIGNILAAKSTLSDSSRITSINQYLLNELKEPRKCRIYFYSANIHHNSYRCRIDLSDTTTKKSNGLSHPTQHLKKNVNGLACSNFATASNKKLPGLNHLDTVFQVLHSIDCINFLIAKSADSVALNGSGCAVKDHTVKHIIVFEPPVTDHMSAGTIKLLNIHVLDTVCNNINRKVFGPFISSLPPDSICWKLVKPCPGLMIKPLKGKGDSCVLSLKRDNSKACGEIRIMVTPFKDTLFSITSEFRVMVRACDVPKSTHKAIQQPDIAKAKVNQGNAARSSHRSTKNDTAAVNQLRRQIINDFRELLFMYTKTQTLTEQKFFRTSALNKIREIPDVRVDIIPKNDISTFLDDIATGSSAWALPKVTPIIDKRSLLIVGVTIEQK